MTDRQQKILDEFKALGMRLGHTPAFTDMSPGLRTRIHRHVPGGATAVATLVGFVPNTQGKPARPLPSVVEPVTVQAFVAPDTGIDLDAERAASLRRQAERRQG